MKNTMSSLVVSANKNIDILKQFLKFYDLHAGLLNFKLYIGLEYKDKVFNNNNQLHFSDQFWSNRLIKYLQVIPDDFILVLLDDFFIEKEIKMELISEALNLLINDSKIANVSLMHFSNHGKSYPNSNFSYKKKNSQFLVSFQAGIWRKKHLLRILKMNENPWETEIFGSIRASILDLTFLCLNENVEIPIYYNYGWLVVRGYWNENEINRLKAKSIFIETGTRGIKSKNLQKKSLIKRISLRLKILIYFIIAKLRIK